MIIVFVLLLGVLQCSVNKYTMWNQGVNYVDGKRFIFQSHVQKHIFIVLELLIQGEYTDTPFLLVPVLFWILSYVVYTFMYRSVILMI